MEFNSDFLRDRLASLDAQPAARWLVAFSGGLDSTAMLHALATAVAGRSTTPVVAVHVRHDLHDDAEEWDRHCRELATRLGIEYVSRRVTVPRDSGLGLEAAAREQRYRALADCMRDRDWLLSAHHQDDQAETLLLNLMRGSGVAGLAGIGMLQPLGPGWLVRPLLDVPRQALRDYACAQGLSWLEDPSNAESRFDRNYLRLEVMPRISKRWPAASAKIARSAELAGDAQTLLDDLAGLDLTLLGEPQRLRLSELAALSPPRQRNVLRFAIRQCGLPAIPDRALGRIFAELLPAREDAAPLVAWKGAEARRYRGCLYLLAAPEEPTSVAGARLSTKSPELSIPGLGILRLCPAQSTGIDEALLRQGLELRFRTGGESLCPVGHDHRRKLKKLLQESGIVPWMRDRIPLLYAGDSLVAVGDLWIDAGCASPAGTGICWDGRPAIH